MKTSKQFKAIQIRRRRNLAKLIARNGTQVALARQLGYTNGVFLTHMAGPNPTRPISERTARHIEHKLKLANGWLDRA